MGRGGFLKEIQGVIPIRRVEIFWTDIIRDVQQTVEVFFKQDKNRGSNRNMNSNISIHTHKKMAFRVENGLKWIGGKQEYTKEA